MDTPTEATPSLPTTAYLAVVVLFVVLATAAVGLRIYTRRTIASNLAADDYLIICGLVFCWGLLATAILSAAGGGLNYVKGDPLEAGVLFLKVFFVEPLLEFPALTFIRLSVLFFYKRIFSKIWFARLCIAFAVIVVLWGLAGFSVELTATHPISRAWDLFDSDPYNIDFGAYAISLNAIGIFLDFTTLTLPLPIIYNLHMKLRYKILIAGILWLGAFCVVADSIRLYYSVQEVKSAAVSVGTDRYYIARNVWLWDRITPCASVITACLPTYAPLVKGRDMLESLIRTAGSWLSFGSSRSTIGLRRSSRTDTGGPLPETKGSGSQELHEWERIVDDHGVHSTYIATNDVQLRQVL
ncbi:hypothetical protein F4859DRAFT_515348 [Xylaria cf. heliscus]|nr:hypothetical protein F4859DRAFT_515348 [Xylaria cf. heliscus]